MKALRLALMFLTRIPLPSIRGSVPPLADAVPWFPAVGALIGAVTGGLYVVMVELFGPGLVAAAVTIACGVLITGAFHLDGLGDMADAFGGGSTPERRLEIMKDSRLGTYGVSAVALALVLPVVALGALSPAQGFGALVVAHSLGRAAALWLMIAMSPARADGLGVGYLTDLPLGRALVGSSVGVAVALSAWGAWGAAAVGCAVAAALLVGVLSQRSIGGVSGDVLGAVEQVVEAATLLTAVALARHVNDFPWWT